MGHGAAPLLTRPGSARRAATHLLAFLGGRSKEQCLMAVFVGRRARVHAGCAADRLYA